MPRQISIPDDGVWSALGFLEGRHVVLIETISCAVCLWGRPFAAITENTCRNTIEFTGAEAGGTEAAFTLRAPECSKPGIDSINPLG